MFHRRRQRAFVAAAYAATVLSVAGLCGTFSIPNLIEADFCRASRKTTARMHAVVDCLGERRPRHGRFPGDREFDLRAIRDGWNGVLRYHAYADGARYALVSGGANRRIDPVTAELLAAPSPTIDVEGRLALANRMRSDAPAAANGDDLVVVDGRFVAYPELGSTESAPFVSRSARIQRARRVSVALGLVFGAMAAVLWKLGGPP
ncbi:MAG: hypothetical protein JO197_19820 [Acidobacteria bacterium]|nr:hypothetical protein [Acidobacteriota bacterium]MBV9478608.1 hypothetical protein [Acidobacteriota bacterium]